MKKIAARAEHGADDHRGLTVTAAVMAALALHMSFAATLIKTGTAGERVYAQRATEAPGLIADLGSLPMIHVVGRRAG